LIIWLTGLSGSGKTTLSYSIYNWIKDKGFLNLIWLDGDVLRDTVSPELDFTENSRIKQITKTQRLANHLESQGHIVVVSALYSNSKLLSWNRNNSKDYFEIYMKADIENLAERDTKNLYENAISGNLKNVVGVDIDWEEPQNPDIVIDNNLFFDIEEVTNKIMEKVLPNIR